MNIRVEQATYADVLPFREMYRHEANCQIIHDSSLARGFADAYLIFVDGRMEGYPGRLFEFHTFPSERANALEMFRELLAVSGAIEIEAQTNMPLAFAMLCECGSDITLESVLFHDAFTTNLANPGGVFRPRGPGDQFPDQSEPDGDWVIEVDDKIAANGGYLTHYNPPYGDIYMEAAEPFRRQGYGSYLVQEIKRVCYEAGKKPSARCNPANTASRKTLQRAGFAPVGHLLFGRVAAPQ